MANSSLLRERLVNGRLDIAVLFAGQPERGLAVEPLLLEELFYVTADPDTSPIRLPMRRNVRCWCPVLAAAVQRAAQEAFKKHGLTITPIAEIDSIDHASPRHCIRYRQLDPAMVRALRRRTEE